MENKKIIFLTSGLTPYRELFFEKLAEKVKIKVLCEIVKSKEREWDIQRKNLPNLEIEVMKPLITRTQCAFCPSIINHLRNEHGNIIVGGYSTPTGILAILWMRIHKRPFWLNADGGIIYPENFLKTKIKKFLISSANGWLSSGKKTTEYFKYYGATENRIKEYPFSSVEEKDIIQNILSLDEKKKIRHKLQMKEKFVVLSVGQFIYRKGFDVLLKTEAIRNPEIGVYIVGGRITPEYFRICEEYHLDNVHFVDFKQKNEIIDYYDAADVFVLPTREDIWGLVVNEAMSRGIPVITTYNCIAGLEMVKSGYNGQLVHVDNIPELSDAICHLIYNKLYRKKCSINALKTIKNYTIERMVESHLEVLT